MSTFTRGFFVCFFFLNEITKSYTFFFFFFAILDFSLKKKKTKKKQITPLSFFTEQTPNKVLIYFCRENKEIFFYQPVDKFCKTCLEEILNYLEINHAYLFFLNPRIYLQKDNTLKLVSVLWNDFNTLELSNKMKLKLSSLVLYNRWWGTP